VWFFGSANFNAQYFPQFLDTIFICWRPQTTSFEALLFMLGFGLPLILLAAWFLHKLVEAPMMRWGKK